MNEVELVPTCVCVCVCVLGRILISKQCSCWCRELGVWSGDVRKCPRISSIPQFNSVLPPIDSVHTISLHTCHLSTQSKAHLQFSPLPAFRLQNWGLSQLPMKSAEEEIRNLAPVSRHIWAALGWRDMFPASPFSSANPHPISQTRFWILKTLVCPYPGPSSKYHYSGWEWGVFYLKSFCLGLGHPSNKFASIIL